MNVENESLQHRRRGEDAPKNNHLRLRNVLNVISCSWRLSVGLFTIGPTR